MNYVRFIFSFILQLVDVELVYLKEPRCTVFFFYYYYGSMDHLLMIFLIYLHDYVYRKLALLRSLVFKEYIFVI